MLVKNPWARLRWKGRFSVLDRTSWTPELQRALNYVPSDEAAAKDNGIFWIDWNSVLQ